MINMRSILTTSPEGILRVAVVAEGLELVAEAESASSHHPSTQNLVIVSTRAKERHVSMWG